MIYKILTRLIGIKGDFQHLFFFNEFKELTGKSRKGIFALTLILTFTLMALGFAIGGIKYLKQKMDDPFTNWVNLPISQSYEDKVYNIKDDFSKDSLRNAYKLDKINEYTIDHFGFLNKETGGEYLWRIRSIYADDGLLREIVSEKSGNVVAGMTSTEGADFEFPKCQIILKESSLRDLGYRDLKSIKRISLIVDDIKIYPEVAAIVKELPNRCQAVVTSHFRNLLTMDNNKTNFINYNDSNQLLYTANIEDKDAHSKMILDALEPWGVIELEYDELVLSNEYKDSRVKLYFSDWHDEFTQDSIITKIKSISGKEARVDHFVAWECNGKDFTSIDNPHYLSFNFQELNKVREFSEVLRNEYGVEISMDQVESKENFAIVSALTLTMAAILLGFSILSIVFYVNSLLRTHLEKIKMNLGTLKAFGLNNRFLVSAYIKIILSFLLISIAFALVFCGIYFLFEPLFSDNNYFDIFNIKVFAAITVIVIIAIITSRRTISKTLLKTPGDLIYNR